MITLEFETVLEELETKREQLIASAAQKDTEGDVAFEIKKIDAKIQRALKKTYAQLTPWQKVLVARHPSRPHTKEYIQKLCTNFVPLSGDRCFGNDDAIIGGLALFRGHPVVVIGHEKGCDMKERVHHNFGMPYPEGYRKARRLIELADAFSKPVITFIDTPGAYPGIDAEERGQSQAIAECIEASLCARIPFLSVIIGEGGSGGAIALASSNHVAMLEHAVYSVISPEGCASILWRSREKKAEAARAQKMTAQDLLSFQIIDHVIPEPLGGAHRDARTTIQTVGDHLEQILLSFRHASATSILNERREKFHQMTTVQHQTV